MSFFKKEQPEKNSSSCDACSLSATAVDDQEIQMMRSSLPNWSIFTDQGVRKISKCFHFENFKEALKFTNKIGQLAEKHNHHPEITTSWGKVAVVWWSHGIKDLTLKDLDLAAGTEELVK